MMIFRSVLAMGLLAVCLAQRPRPPPSIPSSTIGSSTNDDPSTAPETVSKEPVLVTKPPPRVTTRAPSKPASYWITYSKTVRPGHPMVFQVHILKGTLPVDILIVLKNVKGDEVLRHGPVSVQPMVSSSIAVDIPLDIKKPSEDRWAWQSYTVEMSGRSREMSIKEKGQATYEKKSFSIFVQTDKAMYKPSQKVQFRTLAMTPDMKVMRDIKQDIVVFDPKGNRILQYRGVNATEKLGVFEKSFRLASSVPTGTWKISVTIEGVSEEKEFEVSQYVLPRFEVEVDGLSYGIVSDLIYRFTVRAKYTFGKPLTEGNVVVSIRLHDFYYGKPTEDVMRRGKLDKDGNLELDVTTEELRGLYPYAGNGYVPDWLRYEIEANVTEARTGRTHSGRHVIQFHKSPMKMNFLGITPNSFKSGLDYTAYIEVKKQDGTLFSARELKFMSVMINVTYSVPMTATTVTATSPTAKPGPVSIFPIAGGVPERRERKELKLDKNVYNIPETGWIIVSFRVPDGAKYLNIKATSITPFKSISIIKYVSESISPSDSFLQLNVHAKKPRVGDTVRVQAKATDLMKTLTYQVFSKNLLVATGQVDGPSSNLEFQFGATVSMSPSLSIVAFYVRDDGEFVVDALSLSVEGLFDNAVSANFSKKSVQPGEPVNLVVKGEPDSVVFVLVVDKSVKLLKSGNDITQDMVREELASYTYGNNGHWRYMYICGWPSYFGGNDARSVIDNAGIAVMTDGLIYSRYNDADYPSTMDFRMMRGMPVADALPMASEMGGGSVKPPSRVRKLFPENWLWTAKIINSQGEAVFPLTSPDTITSWLASVFSVNSNTGLSVGEKPAEVTTFRNMFVSLDLPPSIVRGEDFCFPASVFSYYPGNIPVILTLEKSSDFSNIWVQKENGEIVLNKIQMHHSYFVGFLNENDVKSMTFCFTPTTIGTIPIRVSAMTDVDGLSDAVERKLRVKAEGVPHTTTISYLVTPTDGVWTQTIPVRFPADTVQGSERISVNIAGNLLGSVFENLDDLLQKPYGCGEQNMINFSPIMSLVDFFFTTNTITEEFRQKAIDYMLIGYQKEILYEHRLSGGYSTFGNRDETKESPSMWLTAFVTKCFSQAEVLDMKYQNILAMDVDRIYRSAIWMVGRRNQEADGKFVENGRVFNKGLQGGSSKGVALTSYTIISLHNALKVLNANPNYSTLQIVSGMKNAVMYLERNLNNLTDPYDVCITTYALVLVGSRRSNESFLMMEGMAKKGYGMTYWEREKKEVTAKYYWSRNTDAINIEMTSYALLTYSLLGISTTQGLPVLRWLSKQKGPNGGFISTQDTVIGIEALTSVAKDLYGAEFVPMTVTVSSESSGGQQTSKQFQVTKDNEMLLQRNDIPYQSGSEIGISAQTPSNMDTSKSTVLVDVVFNYNVRSETNPQTYGMEHELLDHGEGFDLLIKIWTTDGVPASMSILEVDVPAGYEPDMESIQTANKVFISDVEMTEDRLNVYINTDVINGEGIKLKLLMMHTGGTLTKALGKTYRVYDYYESVEIGDLASTSIHQKDTAEKELSKVYYLQGKGDFCTVMPEFGICPYQ